MNMEEMTNRHFQQDNVLYQAADGSTSYTEHYGCSSVMGTAPYGPYMQAWKPAKPDRPGYRSTSHTDVSAEDGRGWEVTITVSTLASYGPSPSVRLTLKGHGMDSAMTIATVTHVLDRPVETVIA